MGEYDAKANINYILAANPYPKVAYVGHSQGTSQMFYALAEHEDDYADKISVFIALGPVVRLNYCKSDLLTFIGKNDELILDVFEFFGIYEIFPANWFDSTAVKLICGVLPDLCELAVSIFADEDTSLDDEDRLSVYLSHFPAGTSLKCLDHFAQLMSAPTFQRYDYGEQGNIEAYGTSTPPRIPLAEMKGSVPIAMFVGQKDELADTIDNEWAYSEMGSDVVVFYNEYNLGHLSFLVADDMSFFTVDALNLLK